MPLYRLRATLNDLLDVKRKLLTACLKSFWTTSRGDEIIL